MDESKILILGANGQLGKALQDRYPSARTADSLELDITNMDAMRVYGWDGIETVINAAAYTNVDGAETEEGRRTAWAVNAHGARNLAMTAIVRRPMLVVHISTDYVFDGKQSIHTEDEKFSPLGVYGQSKAAGDAAISLLPNYYNLRTSWVIGEGKNFVQTMLGLGEKDIAPTVVGDQIGRLTFTSELVGAIDHLLSHKADYGTYNVTNSGESVSWADITREIFSQAGYTLNVTDATTVEYFASKANIAPRPLQSTLHLDKIQATGFQSTDWREALASYISKEAAT